MFHWMFLQSQGQLCLEESELEDIGRILLSYALKDAEGVTVCEQDGPRINYDGFSLVCSQHHFVFALHNAAVVADC